MRFSVGPLLRHGFRAAGPMVMSALGFARAVLACVPAAGAAVLALLVGRLSQAGRADVFGEAVAPLALFAVVLLLGSLAEAAVTPLEYLLKSRIDGAQRLAVARLASTGARFDELEQPAVQEMISAVSADPKNRVEYTVADGVLGQIRWRAGILGVVAAGLVVARYDVWLVPWLLGFAVAARGAQHRQAVAILQKLRLAYREELFADVWRQATVSPGAGKDVRIFGFAGWMVARMQGHIRIGNVPFWTAMEKSIRQQWRTLLLVSSGLALPFLVVTLDAARGSGVAAQTAVLSAGWALFGAFADSADLHRAIGAKLILDTQERLEPRLGGQLGAPDAAPDAALPPAEPGAAPPLVRFDRVSFGYPGTSRTVLDELELEIRPGELLAVVGMNGAGKSTLIKLLAGLYHPGGGQILLDGTALTPASADAWRQRICVVFQDFVRYPLSAADNIELSRPAIRPVPGGLQQAADTSGFAAVLQRLPAGWQTPLSRSRAGGVDLSGGQWQQVVLTRALYAVAQGAKLLVLDEPTAHLDVRSEFAVFDRLVQHRGDTSIVLISHRLSTVRRADRIVLLEGGRITESGTHDELITLGGGYATMFDLQASRFR